jgi:hypothetical protein
MNDTTRGYLGRYMSFTSLFAEVWRNVDAGEGTLNTKQLVLLQQEDRQQKALSDSTLYIPLKKCHNRNCL